MPGDTSWGVIPSGSRTHRQCGCNSGGWTGYGMYYGGIDSKGSNTARKSDWSKGEPTKCSYCGCQGGRLGVASSRTASKRAVARIWACARRSGSARHRLAPRASGDGKFGANWKDLAKGWNDLTVRYDGTVGEIQLFVNGKPAGAGASVVLGKDYEITSFGGSYDGHVGLAYAYQGAVADYDILDRAQMLRFHFDGANPCGTSLLQRFTSRGKWQTEASLDVGATTEVG